MSATPGFSQSVDLTDNYNMDYSSLDDYKPYTIGSFSAGGSIGTSVGFDDNIHDSVSGKTTGPYLQSDVYAWLNSQWERHAFNLSAYGSKYHYPGKDEANEYFANVFAYGRIDLADETQAEIVGSYQFDEDARGEGTQLFNPAVTPGDHNVDLKTFLTQRFGDAALTVRGGVRKGLHDEVRSNGGVSLDRDDGDYLLYDIRTRASLNVGESSNIFVEAGVNKWDFDQTVDRNGYVRGSKGGHVATGFLFQPSQALSGEIAAGYRYQTFPDPSFNELSTVTLDAWLRWAVTERFNLTMVTDTWFDEETNFGDAGTLSRSFTVQADYRLRDKLRIFGIGYYLTEDDIDSVEKLHHTVKLTGGVDYEIRPNLVMTAQVQHERFYAGYASGDFNVNRVWVGVKFSR